MTKYLAVYDREDGWRIIGKMKGSWIQQYTRSGRKAGQRFEQDSRFYGESSYPECKSCFIQAHRVIEAESEEEACRLTLTFLRPSSETLLQSR